MSESSKVINININLNKEILNKDDISDIENVKNKGYYISLDEFDINKINKIHCINLEVLIPNEIAIGNIRYMILDNDKDTYFETVSNTVKKTYKLIFDDPLKFTFGDSLYLYGIARDDKIDFKFSPTLTQWKKWKNQKVKYDNYSHYFSFLEKEYLFSNGGYGSHMEIKSKNNLDDEQIINIYEIQFYFVHDIDNTITISDIRKDIYEYENSLIVK
jgi:hypothetical protein